MKTNKLYRIINEKMIGGVAAGFARYFDIDPTLMRVLFVLAFFITGFAPMVLIYIVLWAILPKAIKESNDDADVIKI
ncbi:MAG: PspC domain-containing protein [Spirosomataceae bacterium]